MDKVVKVKPDLYERARDLAKEEGVSIAEAIAKLVETGNAGVPSACQLQTFGAILREQGLTPPRRPDWVWSVTDVLPSNMLVGTKLEPYSKARVEAELRCAIGDELYGKLVAGELSAEEKVSVEILQETSKTPVTEPVTEPVAEPVAEPVTD